MWGIFNFIWPHTVLMLFVFLLYIIDIVINITIAQGENMSFQGVEFTPDMRKMAVNVKLFFDNLKSNAGSLSNPATKLAASALGISPHFSWTLCQFSESVFIVSACHPFDLTRNFHNVHQRPADMITSGVSLRSLTCSVATPANIDYYGSLECFLNM